MFNFDASQSLEFKHFAQVESDLLTDRLLGSLQFVALEAYITNQRSTARDQNVAYIIRISDCLVDHKLPERLHNLLGDRIPSRKVDVVALLQAHAVLKRSDLRHGNLLHLLATSVYLHAVHMPC